MTMDARPLWNWINERHAIYIRKSLAEGIAPHLIHTPQDPFFSVLGAQAEEWGALTLDPILAQYRFCNVFRELDRVTVWIRQNIRERYRDHPNLWFMLAIARTINWPPTLQYLLDYEGAWPHYADDAQEFSPRNLGRALDHYQSEGNKVYTGAYMIRAESDRNKDWYSWSKQRYIAEIVLGRLWEDRGNWRDFLHTDDPDNQLVGLQDAWELFQSKRYIGWGPFMAYQVVVDLRWTRYLENAPDINTWAALGPGSRRGLNRLAGRDLDFPLKQDQGLEEMRSIWEEQDRFRAPWVPRIDLSDIQNALCETDKYLRVKNGEGRPRAQYVPGRGW